MAENIEEENLSEADLSAFADKLDTWADDLPADERGLLQYLLARAESAGPGELVSAIDEGLSTSASPGQLATGMLKPVLEHGLTIKSETEKMRAMRSCTWSTWSRGTPP